MVHKIIPDVLRSRRVAHVGGDTTVRQAAQIMRERDIGSVLIVGDRALEGILTVNDMTYRVVAAGLDPDRTLVREVMTPDPDTVDGDTTVIEALRLMQDGGYRHLPVVEGGRLRGIVSRRDICGLDKARLDEETALWERLG